MRVEPDKGHAIYFFETGEVLVEGSRKIYFFDSEAKKAYKKIEIGDFTATIGFGRAFSAEPISTTDHFKCGLKIILYLSLDDSAKNLAENLAKITRTFGSFEHDSDRISHADLERYLQKKMQGMIVGHLERAVLSGEIEETITTKMNKTITDLVESVGFSLTSYQVGSLTFEFDEVRLLVDDSLKKPWEDFKARELEIARKNSEKVIADARIVADEAVTKEQIDLEKQARIDELKEKHKWNLEVENKKNEEEATRQIAELDRSILDILKEEKKAELNREIELAAHEYEQQTELEKKKIAADLEKMAEIAKKEEEHIKAEEQLNKLNELLLVRETETAESEAKAIKLRNEAANSHHERMLEALPKLLQQMNATFPQVKEPKIFYIGGNPHGDGKGETDLSSLFTSLSAFPLLREVMSFMNGFEKQGENSQ